MAAHIEAVDRQTLYLSSAFDSFNCADAKRFRAKWTLVSMAWNLKRMLALQQEKVEPRRPEAPARQW